MKACYLGLGSNLDAPQRHLRQAISAIKALPHTQIVNCSNLRKTKAWGFDRQPDFYNCALAIRTRIQPRKLLLLLQKIEKKQGRIRKKQWGPRTLDIDLLLYAQERINTPKLIVPHPYILQRSFVLEPLLELGLDVHAYIHSICSK